MDTLLIIGAIFLGCIGLYFLLHFELQKHNAPLETTALSQWLQSLQLSIDRTNRAITEAMRGQTGDVARMLQTNTRQVNERLDTASQIIGDLKKNLGEMSEVGRGIRSLQEFLQSPKMRGNIGEQVLADMIQQAFPKKSFHLQYTFHSGVKVDAVLQTDAGLLCIDAKFPMENFARMHKGETEHDRMQAKKDFVQDVKKHLQDIANKYILPEEGTMDFALMYIPSESVYYEVANMQMLMDAARELRVYPVSPNTLYAHLQVLLLSFQGKELEEKSREVFRLLRAIQKDYEKITDGMGTLGKHVTNAYNSMSSVTTSVVQLGQKLDKTKRLSSSS